MPGAAPGGYGVLQGMHSARTLLLLLLQYQGKHKGPRCASLSVARPQDNSGIPSMMLYCCHIKNSVVSVHHD
jgi:hypothetical protein